MTTNARDEKWSEWYPNNGVDNPIPSGAFYEVKDERGEVTPKSPLVNVRWRIEGDGHDIIAYRYRLDDNTMTTEEAELPAQEWGADGGHDPVNKPKHYQLREGYEVYDLRQDLARKAQASGVPHDQFSDWDRALEYLLRMWDKNGVEDAKKGAWYVNKLVEKLEASALRAEELEG